MTDDRRSEKPARGAGSGRSGQPGRSGGRPSTSGGRDAKSYARGDGKPSAGRGDGKPSTGRGEGKSSTGRGEGKPAGRDSKPGGRNASAGSSGGRSGYSGDRRSPSGGRPQAADKAAPRRAGSSDSEDQRAAHGSRRRVAEEVYHGPDIPAEITGQELDRSVTAQLKGLPEKLAARVVRHLAAAGVLMDTDPETAYQHTLAARARASRIAVVREATGEAAYAAGHYAEALAELRAAKRMNGATAYLPIMADCHRALGQAEQAIKLAKSPGVANFSSEAKAEMTIVEAGARRDLKQYDAALRVLEQAPLMSTNRDGWVARLRYAYADTLEEAGQLTEALSWFHRTEAIDGDGLTDAADRAAGLEKRISQQNG